jgi:hypothetical protein
MRLGKKGGTRAALWSSWGLVYFRQAEITATILCVRGSRIRISSPTRM